MARIDRKIEIPEDEIVLTFSRSSGPGGQNVNKLNTRVTLYFDPTGSKVLTDEEKQRIYKKFKSNLEKDGSLKIICQTHRTQAANRKAAIERLQELLSEALREPKIRHKTKVPWAAKLKRLEKKRRRSFLKKQRSNIPFEEQ